VTPKLGQAYSLRKPPYRPNPCEWPMDVEVYYGKKFMALLEKQTARLWPGGGFGLLYRGRVYRLTEQDGGWAIDISSGSRSKKACPATPVVPLPPPSSDSFRRPEEDAKLIERLPEMPLPDTIKVWQNALRWLQNGSKAQRQRAQDILPEIYADWNRRYSEPIDLSGYFTWPRMNSTPGSGTICTADWLELGVLRALGYSVNEVDNLGASTRRLVLAEVFGGVLPPAFPRDHLDEWGEPKSAARLKKMAECIAGFARLANRRRDHSMDAALQRWEQDLGWLYDHYYVGTFRFGWPSTEFRY
jgi:hypothetical protein